MTERAQRPQTLAASENLYLLIIDPCFVEPEIYIYIHIIHRSLGRDLPDCMFVFNCKAGGTVSMVLTQLWYYLRFMTCA